jgi:hypothetical protein
MKVYAALFMRAKSLLSLCWEDERRSEKRCWIIVKSGMKQDLKLLEWESKHERELSFNV